MSDEQDEPARTSEWEFRSKRVGPDLWLCVGVTVIGTSDDTVVEMGSTKAEAEANALQAMGHRLIARGKARRLKQPPQTDD